MVGAGQNHCLGKLDNLIQFISQFAKFRIVAKLPHTKYDASRLSATLDRRKNDVTVAAIASSESRFPQTPRRAGAG